MKNSETDFSSPVLTIVPPPKIAAVHDISCIGRCAATVIIPVLSVMGIQVCPLPTALLSTHTGGYEGFTFLDLTDEIHKITTHWNAIGTKFDAVYSGFLGSAAQIEAVLKFAESCKKISPGCLFLADPVMGDGGSKYATYTDEMCRLTRRLVAVSDITTPNLTEACILLGIPYRDTFTEKEIERMTEQIAAMGAKNVIITGVTRENEVGAAYYESKTGAHGAYFTPRDPKNYPGTGDVFASVILAGQLKQIPLAHSVKKACDFIFLASRLTTACGTPVREGLAIEGILAKLAEPIRE